MKAIRLITLVTALVLALAGLSSAPVSGEPPDTVPGDGPFDTLHFRSIGPANMSGRISDLAVYEADPAIYYVGTAHGGVWKTVNNGTTFEAQLQDYGLMSIGDVAISQSNPDLVWVGTGESNNRQSTSWGEGVYKSIDGGKTYTHMGLRTSRHINRIVIDPKDNNVVFVAATGSLWGPGGERGVYKTTDGGKTWKQVLAVDEDTGANDLVMDPADHLILYGSTYQRRRTTCCMNGGGSGSGIWKSTDGGDHWTRLSEGIPEGSLGRIALDIYRRRPHILYALIEGPTAGRGGAPGGGEEGEQTGGSAQRGARGGEQTVSPAPTGLYRSDDAGKTWRKVNNANPRPMYFSQVRIDPNDPEVVYLGGVGLHQTLDGGKTMATDVASSTHDDVHAIWINPANSNHILIGNDGGLAASYDKAKTWVFLPNLPVGLFYHVSYDMATPYNVCGGMQDNYAWCGPSAVRGAAGISSHQWITVQGGDGFVVLQDPTEYRIAYSESQNGNMVRVDRVTGETMAIRPQPGEGEDPFRWQWDTPMVISTHDPKVLYVAAHRVFRSPDRGLSWSAISPDLTSNADRDEIVTMGVKNSEIRISRNDGISSWPCIVAIAESEKRAGLLYAGTEDGRLSVTRDGGKTWTDVFGSVAGVPPGSYVSKVVPSRFNEGTVYATFDGHRENDFSSYIYASEDFGQTWRSISSNLEGEVARTLTEDLRNPEVLYLGTETGLFVSLDRGGSWKRIKANLPTVRIDEITLHPRDNAMILATHGRAIWILDHLEPIQEYAAMLSASAGAGLFTPPPYAMYRRPARDRNYEFWGEQVFFGENPPQAALVSWHLKNNTGDVRLVVKDAAGKEVRNISGEVLEGYNTAGIQSACWDLRVQPGPEPVRPGGGRAGGPGSQQEAEEEERKPEKNPFGAGCGQGGGGLGGGGFGAGGGTAGPFVLPGSYNVSLVVDGKTVDTKPLRVVADSEVLLTEVERKRMFDMAYELHELHGRGTEVANALVPLNRRMAELTKEIEGRSDLPGELKSSFEAVNKELVAVAPKFAAPAGARGGGGGGRGGANPSLVVRLGQTKGALMSGMWPTDQTIRSYNELKIQLPAAVAEANALFTKVATLSNSLAQHKLTLTAPAPVK